LAYTIISVSNFAYRRLALNWSIALKNLKIKNYRIYSLDRECHDYLLKKDVNSVLLPSSDCDSFNKTLSMKRFYIIEELLSKGEAVIYSDVDAVWVQDPTSDLGDFDMHFSVAVHPCAYPRHIREKWGSTICTGWLAFKSTALPLIQDFIKNHEKHNGGRADRDDQYRFNAYIDSKEPHFNKPPLGHTFSFNIGKLKALGLCKNLILRGNLTRKCKVCHPPTPKISDKKIKTLKRSNLWFLDK
jgi:hypothetical protein